MSKQRNRWVVIAVLSIATLAFVGVSVIVPFTKALQNNNPIASPSPSLSPSASPKEDLEAQARGYELVLQREPDNQIALRGLVDTRIAQSRTDPSKINSIIAPLEKLAKLNPDQSNYSVLLAQAKQQTGDREGAAQAYRAVLELNRGDMNALKGLVDLLMQQQRPEAAIGLLQDTLKSADEVNKAKPGSVDVISVEMLLGQVYAVQQRYDEAIATYDKAAQSNKEDFRPLLGKALVLQDQGKTEEAQPLFTSAAALAPAQFKDQINQLAAGESPSPAASVVPSPSTGEPAPSPSAETAAPAPSAAPEASPESP
ncbi:MAG: tetratricopeptide repeat protein [Drouetiella hepatica Uher 2000/2452]|uniref:Tetratricopeptide repeat protein n=1 Tax=Drouetiella hepatica Uher 2000/2452 TaxID=904376 RepID=A0A951UQ89_9CYAN|nr:tetratricopeptide repeat protein [Drouetiella hepatica Uher 2000/2452]